MGLSPSSVPSNFSKYGLITDLTSELYEENVVLRTVLLMIFSHSVR